MATRTRRTRLLDRTVQNRDARLFIVATEGQKTEPAYFQWLQEEGIVDRTRIKIAVVNTPDHNNASAPEYVLERLVEFEQQYTLIESDERWIVFDVDRWGDKKLSQVTRQTQNKGYQNAISNPCFEVWLLHHHLDPLPATIVKAADAEAELRAALGGSYNKARPDMSACTKATVRTASERARALAPDGKQRWPQSLGTHVYRLMDRLLV